ncbi:MAG: hypothetical protein V1884_03950 [Candidatus Omnitrophota bacterium]
MANSIFLAKAIGLYMVIVALGILFNLKIYQRVMEDFSKNSALIYLGGVIALIIGLLILLSHNLWVAGWEVIITIFGWLGLIKGVWLMILPDSLAKLTRAYQKKTRALVVHLVIILVLGAFLIAKGYHVL